MTTLFIKNMVCNRCIMVVQNELDKLSLDVKNIKLGEVTLGKELTDEQKLIVEDATAKYYSGEEPSFTWEEVKNNVRKSFNEKKS